MTTFCLKFFSRCYLKNYEHENVSIQSLSRKMLFFVLAFFLYEINCLNQRNFRKRKRNWTEGNRLSEVRVSLVYIQRFVVCCFFFGKLKLIHKNHKIHDEWRKTQVNKQKKFLFLIFFWRKKNYAEVRSTDCDLPVVRLISIARWRCPNTLNCGRDTSLDTPTELGPSFHL